MKISARMLSRLIREAAFEGPGTASVRARSDQIYDWSATKQMQVKMMRLHVSRIDGEARPFGNLVVYLTGNPMTWGSNKHRGELTSKVEFNDVLRSLGFSPEAIRSVEFDNSAVERDGGISMTVEGPFIDDWRSMFGNQKTVDLT